MKRVAALVGALVLLAACGSSTKKAAAPSCPTTAAPAGETHQTLTSGGVARTYIRHVVASTTPRPLVLDLHGYSESADIHVKFSGLAAYGDTHGFDTLVPSGVGNPVRWDVGLDSPDMHFVRDLIDEAKRTMCVDAKRVYVAGLSNGAFMASSVACALADRVAAVAPVAGLRDPDGCAPSRAVPIIAFHGTADQFVRYDGGLGQAALNLPAPDGSGRTIGQSGGLGGQPAAKSVPDILAAWATREGCAGQPTTTSKAADVDLLAYRCPSGRAVELYRIAGGGHAWPGSPVSAAVASLIGPTTMSISANDLIWDFFSRHPLP